jgi:hypothetical protein
MALALPLTKALETIAGCKFVLSYEVQVLTKWIVQLLYRRRSSKRPRRRNPSVRRFQDENALSHHLHC